MNKQPNQKQSKADNSQADQGQELVPAAGQGQREGNQQSGSRQSGSQQSGSQQSGQQSGQRSGSQQQGQQQGSQQHGGQHASGGTPALDDLDHQQRGESARQASEAFKQQDDQGGKR
ncbi:hypothetical protein IM543_15145 [Massilia sp. UMI-21]|nr:hypothetical protein IM543_15145 [Massilia sp. UMI-21]